jgi:hypothetical protein
VATLTLLIAVLLAPTAFASQPACFTCKSVFYNNGEIYMFCDRPDPLQWGSDYCTVDYYPEGAYCYEWGYPCCVDPWM